ncbi:MAG: extracellular solute-binding protein [Oscillospiraceae bacterium]|nr:extracellular solute-binding protein [Oscillospiraceae bacterium]
MKFSKIKIIAFILTIIMLCALALNIIGCGNGDSGNDNDGNTTVANNENGDGGSNDDAKENDANTEKSDNSIEARPDYDLPEKDFGNYDFRIISRSESANLHWWNYDISAEGETGDPINDAVFQRNQKIEEKYNITITNIPDSAVGSKAARSIKAGSDDYDLVVIGLRDGQDNLINSGYLMDLHSMPYVDLSKPWWDQKATEQLSIYDKLFATSCDLTIRDKDAIIILMFSKTLLKDNQLEDPYQLVLSGKWTLDKMFDMMKTVSKDLNGDGKMDDEDQYGLISQLRHSQYFYNAAGEYISKLNADNIPEITMYNERAVEICEKIGAMQGDKNYSICADEYNGKYADVWDDFQVPLFAENRALFYHAGMNRVTLLRTMETDFGILPPPKFEESQTNYYVAVDAWCTSAVSVPITAEDKDRSGLILETLAYESRYILLPAYYDINLKTKFARDEESREMIDIILTNRLYDLGDMYYWGSATSYFEDLSRGKGGSLVTYWEKNSSKIESAMQKTLDKLSALD